MLRSNFNFIIQVILLVKISSIKSDHQSDILIEKILKFEPYQIIAFTSNAELLPVENDILRNIASRCPILKLNLTNFQLKKGYLQFIAISAWITRSIKSSMLLIFGQVNNLSNIRMILKFWIEFSPTIMRPKCIIVFNSPFMNKNDLLSLLEDAWSVSFLDISIVNFTSKNDTIETHNYNPFANTYSSNKLISTTDIFPDKLTDLKGFTINVPYVDIAPDMLKIESHNYSGTRFAVTRFLSSVLNFKIDVLDDMNSSTEWAFAQLKNSKVDMTPIPLFAIDKRIRGDFQIGKVFSFDQNCGLTLIENTIQIKISFSTFFQISLSIFCIFLLTHTVNRFIIQKKNLDVLTSIRLLLGQAGANQPRKNAERILFIYVSILSIIYSPTITAKVMSLVVEYKETRTIHTFEDIIKSELQPYAYSDLLQYEDEHDDFGKSRIVGLDTMSKCINLLERKEKVICILPKRQAEYFQDVLHKKHREEFLTITGWKFTLWEECYYFSSGSPYLEKFDLIIQRMLESGLPKTQDLMHFLTPTSNSNRWNETDSWFVSVQYLIIYLIGCILSIILFFVELLNAYYNKE